LGPGASVRGGRSAREGRCRQAGLVAAGRFRRFDPILRTPRRRVRAAPFFLQDDSHDRHCLGGCDERDEFVRCLAESFPKCFFEEPAQRRPLKRDIIDDLEERKVLSRDKLLCALGWYEGHFTYRYPVIAGAERVDLDGKKAGTVTAKEQQEVRAWVAARKHELKEQQMVTPPPSRYPLQVSKKRRPP
jgi:ProQ/FINO family